MRVAVIGGGIFGCMAAIRLQEAGHAVMLVERNAGPLQGASYNNQNRLHLGYHYPRDEETARQCLRGFQRFRTEFADCIVETETNAYFVASSGSLTAPADYLKFADRLGLASLGWKPRLIDPRSFHPKVCGVEVGVAAPEVIYDCAELRTLIERRLAGVSQIFNAEVFAIARRDEGFLIAFGNHEVVLVDAVVNCTYADANRLTAELGHPCDPYQYEYTAVPIIEWDQPPIGITIMDGPFFSVVPFGRSGKFLLYHVEHSVLSRTVATQMPAAWRDAETAPQPTADLFERMLAACAAFVPTLADARQVGLLQGPRVVLAGQDRTDARPSIVSAPEPRFVNIFASKIDHCMRTAREAVETLRRAA